MTIIRETPYCEFQLYLSCERKGGRNERNITEEDNEPRADARDGSAAPYGGVLSLVGEPRAAHADATVNTTDELTAAVQEGGTVTLGDDIELDVPLAIAATTTLDLNGHTLTSTSATNAIELPSRSEALLTIRDSSAAGSGAIKGVGSRLISGSYQTKMITIEGGSLVLDSSETHAWGVDTTSGDGFTMTGGSIKVTSKGSAYGASISGGTVSISGDSRIEADGPNLSKALEARSTSKVDIAGNAYLQGDVSAAGDTTFSGDIEIVSEYDYPTGGCAIQVSMGAFTIDGGTYTVVNKGMFNYYNEGQTRSFIINDGTFNTTSTFIEASTNQASHAPVILNGGTFNTTGDSIPFAISWAAHENVTVNGGYLQKPMESVTYNDGNAVKYTYPTGFGLSEDTLGALTGDDGEHADYLWVTKATDVTFVTDGEETPGKAYAVYAEGSQKADTSASVRYVTYNPAVPMRDEPGSFLGWSTDPDAQEGELASTFDAGTQDITLYSIWTDADPVYTVRFDANGGTGTLPADINEDKNYTLANLPDGDGLTKANATFGGWATTPDATARNVTTQTKIEDIRSFAKAVPSGRYYDYVITLYAVWEPKVSIGFGDQEAAYTGKPIAYDVGNNSVGVTDGFTVTYYSDYQYKAGSEVAPADVVEPGWYYVLIERPEDDTYAAVSERVHLEIEPLGSAWMSVSSYVGEYDGLPHTVTVKVNEPSEGYTVRYESNNNVYDLDEAPTFTDVCSYKYVYAKVTAPGWEPDRGSSYVTIRKATSSIAMGDVTAVYDGSAHGVTATVTNSAGVEIAGAEPTVTYYADAACTQALDGAPTEAGAYYAKAVLEGTKNYSAAEATATLTITRADGTLSFDDLPDGTLTKHIDDEAFTVAASVKGDGIVTYASGDPAVAAVDESTGEVTIKGAGTTTITATLSEGDNYAGAEQSYALTVTDHVYKTTVVEPTCDAGGYTVDVCSVCGDSARHDETAATGHAWGEPTWTWSDDLTMATATFTCANDEAHEQTVVAELTAEVTRQPTIAEEGAGVATATVSFEGARYTDEQAYTIAKLPDPTPEPEQGDPKPGNNQNNNSPTNDQASSNSDDHKSNKEALADTSDHTMILGAGAITTAAIASIAIVIARRKMMR